LFEEAACALQQHSRSVGVLNIMGGLYARLRERLQSVSVTRRFPRTTKGTASRPKSSMTLRTEDPRLIGCGDARLQAGAGPPRQRAGAKAVTALPRDSGALRPYPGHRRIRHTVHYIELAPARFKDFGR
jgi:hypothetical protein